MNERISGLLDDYRIVVPSATVGCLLALVVLRLTTDFALTVSTGVVLLGGPLAAVLIVSAVLLMGGTDRPPGQQAPRGTGLGDDLGRGGASGAPSAEGAIGVDGRPDEAGLGHGGPLGSDGPPAPAQQRPPAGRPHLGSREGLETGPIPQCVSPPALRTVETLMIATIPGPETGKLDAPPILSAVRVAQCPECGEHRVNVQSSEGLFTFSCTKPGCLQQPWQWRRGWPWPAPSPATPHIDPPRS